MDIQVLIFLFKKSHANLNITSLIPDFLDGSITEKYDFDEKTIHEYFLPLDPSSVDLWYPLIY